MPELLTREPAVDHLVQGEARKIRKLHCASTNLLITMPNGPLRAVQLEAMGVARIHLGTAVDYVNDLVLQGDSKMPTIT